ncbi:MAG: LysR family transcriptional regulator [Gammaproteobacteria bacterium]|nr:LysR family transcriptional regulator [Gammaproteobacteria bacterium]
MMKIDLEQLEILDAIERRGSFAAAAEELHRVPSALTYQVRQLEERLGTAVFDRSGHRAVLTDVGQVLLQEGRAILAAADQLERRLQSVAGGWEAELRIVISDLFPSHWFWPLVRDFRQTCKQTRLVLRRETFGGVWEALLDDRADLAIGISGEQGGSSRIRSRHFMDVDWAFAMAPEHPLAALPEPLSRADIEAHCVVAAEDSSRRLVPRKAGITSGRDILNVPDMQAKLDAQLAGIGVGYLPRFLVAGHLAGGVLVEREVDEARGHSSLHLGWRRGAGRAIADGKALKWWLARLEGWNPLMEGAA